MEAAREWLVSGCRLPPRLSVSHRSALHLHFFQQSFTFSFLGPFPLWLELFLAFACIGCYGKWTVLLLPFPSLREVSDTQLTFPVILSSATLPTPYFSTLLRHN